MGTIITDSDINQSEYGGSTIKFGVTYRNRDFIVKLAESGDLSVYSEYIASSFIEKLGIPVHKTYLVKYSGSYTNNKVVPAVMLLDFTKGVGGLHEFLETRQSSEQTPLQNKGYTYSDIVDMIEKHTKLVPALKQTMVEHFWKQFICDAILANRDRHGGNWGYLKKAKGVYVPAPIYDNGNSLFPNINQRYSELSNLNTVEELKEFFKERVYTYPASIIMVYDESLKRNRRTNYAEMFKDFRKYPVLGKLVKQLTSQVKLEDVMQYMYDIVRGINDLDILYKRFYIFIVCLRFMCIVKREPYDRAFKKVYSLARANNII